MLLKKMTELLQPVNVKLDKLAEQFEDVRTWRTNVDTTLQNHQQLMTQIVDDGKRMGGVVQTNCHRLNRQEERLDDMEDRDRSVNLIFRGFEERPNEDTSTMIQTLLTSKLAVPQGAVVIERSHRLGPVYARGSRPIIARIPNREHRHLVFQAKAKLRQVNAVEQTRFVVHGDYSPNTRKRQAAYRVLQRHLYKDKIQMRMPSSTLVLEGIPLKIDLVDGQFYKLHSGELATEFLGDFLGDRTVEVLTEAQLAFYNEGRPRKDRLTRVGELDFPRPVYQSRRQEKRGASSTPEGGQLRPPRGNNRGEDMDTTGSS
jgi:hypothetical protein